MRRYDSIQLAICKNFREVANRGRARRKLSQHPTHPTVVYKEGKLHVYSRPNATLFESSNELMGAFQLGMAGDGKRNTQPFPSESSFKNLRSIERMVFVVLKEAHSYMLLPHHLLPAANLYPCTTSKFFRVNCGMLNSNRRLAHGPPMSWLRDHTLP